MTAVAPLQSYLLCFIELVGHTVLLDLHLLHSFAVEQSEYFCNALYHQALRHVSIEQYYWRRVFDCPH